MSTSKFLSLLCLVVCALAPTTRVASAQGQPHWVTGKQVLPSSHGTFVVPKEARMVVGAAAIALDNKINGTTSGDSEGIVEDGDRLLYMTYDDSGHVSADDWKDIDASKMLIDMKDAAIAGNDERKKAGVEAFFIDRWIQAPSYDEAAKRVRWIVGMHDEKNHAFINATALQLGRAGYEKFILVSAGRTPAADTVALTSLTSHYAFNKGFRFNDFMKGDKVAGYGLAALVAAGTGVTLAKTGILAAVLIFLKKFIIIGIALGAGLFTRIKKFFAGRGRKTNFGPPSL